MASFQGGSSSSSAGSSGSASATPVNITGCSASDTWTVFTDNMSGNLYPQVTSAIDPADSAAIALKQSPAFSGPSSIITSTAWDASMSTNWLVSASSSHPDLPGWMATYGTNSYWYSDHVTQVFNTSTGFGLVNWQIKYPVAVTVNSFSFASGAEAGPLQFALHYSDDNSSWNTAQNYNVPQTSYSGDTTLSFAVPPSGSHIYWRIAITKVIPNSSGRTYLHLVRFYTGFTAAGLRLSSVLPIAGYPSAFKIVLTDVRGRPLNASEIPINQRMYITLIKDGQIVNSNKYTLSLPGSIVAS